MCFYKTRIFWIISTRLNFRSCTSLHHELLTQNCSNRIVLILREKNLRHARAWTLPDSRPISLARSTLAQTIKWKVQIKISSVMWAHSPTVTQITRSRILHRQMRLRSKKMWSWVECNLTCPHTRNKRSIKSGNRPPWSKSNLRRTAS